MIKKIIIGLVIVVPLVLIGLGVFAYMSINSVVKDGIETFGPKFTGTAVTVESVKLSPFSGSGTIRGLQVDNPEGFKTPYAFRMGEISISLDTGSLTSDEIIIHEVRVVNPDIIYEQGLAGSNVGKLKKMVEERTASDSEETTDGPKVIIEKFLLTDGKVQLATSLSEKTMPIDLPPVELTDIGRGDSATMADTVREVTVAVTGSIINVVAASGKLADAATETVKGAVKGVSEAGKNAVEGVKNLFNRD